jgi:hypothetical protein
MSQAFTELQSFAKSLAGFLIGHRAQLFQFRSQASNDGIEIGREEEG